MEMRPHAPLSEISPLAQIPVVRLGGGVPRIPLLVGFSSARRRQLAERDSRLPGHREELVFLIFFNFFVFLSISDFSLKIAPANAAQVVHFFGCIVCFCFCSALIAAFCLFYFVVSLFCATLLYSAPGWSSGYRLQSEANPAPLAEPKELRFYLPPTYIQGAYETSNFRGDLRMYGWGRGPW